MRLFVCGFDGDFGEVHVAAGFFYADDVFQAAECKNCFEGHGYAGAGRDIVRNDGEIDGVREFFVVGDDAGLWRAIVVRGYDEGGEGAEVFGFESFFDGGDGVVCAGAENQWDFVADNRFDGFENFADFGVVEGWAFAGGAVDHESVDAVGELVLNQALEGAVIDLAIFKRSDKGGDDSADFGDCAHGCSLVASEPGRLCEFWIICH